MTLSLAELHAELDVVHNNLVQIEQYWIAEIQMNNEFGRALIPLLPIVEAMAKDGNGPAQRLLDVWNEWDRQQREPF